MAARGGIVLQTGRGHRFLPAEVATAVVPAATVVPVPGLAWPAVGLVLTEDRVATVLQVGSLSSDHMIICEIDGGSVALAGARVVATGMFVACGNAGVEWEGHRADDLDVRSLTRQVEASIWRAGGLRAEEKQG